MFCIFSYDDNVIQACSAYSVAWVLKSCNKVRESLLICCKGLKMGISKLCWGKNLFHCNTNGSCHLLVILFICSHVFPDRF